MKSENRATRVRSAVRRIDELLELTYRSADLGNLDDPLDEAVYLLLSKQTREAVYQRLFKDLRSQFPSWLSVYRAPTPQLEAVLRPGGFQRQRASQLKALLGAVYEDNFALGIGPGAKPAGDLTLEHLRSLSDEEIETFLRQLPGVGPKTARCIMAYSFSRASFAVDTHVHRIFTRMRLVPSRTRKLDHDPFQEAVPRALRKRLHINLVHHGRSVCRNTNPKCHDCVLVSFCDYGRARIVDADGPPVAIDLFAGAGGLGSGFRAGGFQVALAVETDRNAAQTYRFNNPGTPVLEESVTKLAGSTIREYLPQLKEPSAVLAGAPCQGYSAAGSREPADPRNYLYRHVSRIASELKAQTVVLENVPGVQRVNGVGFLPSLLASLRRRGYSAAAYLLTSSHFGVPQNRRRYFVLASRSDVGKAPSQPAATHRAFGQPESAACLPETPALKRFLEDLPDLGPGEGAERLVLDGGRVILNATTMRHSVEVVDKIRGIQPGEGPISYRRLTDTEARTLVAGHRALPVHPWLDRTISVREAARIQGFPDSYFFCGPRAEQPLQVANAVPPPMARALAEHLSTYLAGVNQFPPSASER